MPNRKHKKAKLQAKAQSEKKMLLPLPSPPPPPTRCQPPTKRHPPSRRQPPPAPGRRQPSPPPPPPPPKAKVKAVCWQPSSSSPKVGKAKISPQAPQRERPEPPKEAPTITSTPYQANRDWRVLRNHFLPHGTTIEMMYTGQECLPQDEESEQHQLEQEPEQVEQQHQEENQALEAKSHPEIKPMLARIEARPGITHANVHLPPGVLPTTNCLPDMGSYVNAIDFFAHPERHQLDSSAVPRTIVTVTPKSQTSDGQQEQQKATASSTMEVVPLGTYEAPPLEPGFLNMAFQTFSTTDFRPEPPTEGETDPNSTSYNAEISPTMMLTMLQQHRLQAAVLQEEEPLVNALTPIVQDIRKAHAQMQQPPVVHPLPITTMKVYSKQGNIETTTSTEQAPRAGGSGSGPESVPPTDNGIRSIPAPGAGTPRMVLLPTPRMVPIPPSFRNPTQRYPVFVRPNFNPNFCQQPPPERYPAGFVLPNYNPNYVQQPPRYPVFLQPRFLPRYGPPPYPVLVPPGLVPRYGLQPPRYPVFVHPNCIPNYVRPAAPPHSYGRTTSNQI